MEHFAVLFDQLMHLAISLKITDIHIDAQPLLNTKTKLILKVLEDFKQVAFNTSFTIQLTIYVLRF